jgi:NitT/TauT family transport system substrate-binding protein
VVRGLQRRQFSGWAVASALAGPVVSEAAITPQKVSIALAAKGSMFHLPLFLAEQLSFFKQEGLQIEWVECDSGLHAVNTALAGQAEVVSGAFEHIIDLQARGQNFRAFVMQGRTPQISIGLSTRRTQGIKAVTDLKAIKMGVTSLGSSTHWVAQHWIRQTGMVADNVQFVELGASTTQVMEIMRSGNIDALCFTDPVICYLEQKGAHDQRLLVCQGRFSKKTFRCSANIDLWRFESLELAQNSRPVRYFENCAIQLLDG